MRGFDKAQQAYENMMPADGCDCEPLFQCQNCDSYSDGSGVCRVCGADGEPEMHMVEVERDMESEGQYTDPRCDIHNHRCESRGCCD